ncbi:WD40-repeat-containing domain protein [Phascolomyces articulosus]|uniref:WD40-repeat-containing domain protein n=1 Tax=Phascolomyces articulosus TaxID=60185 RepID=A0AAD5KBB0_9FUNG|nr:WD40-repeat-containing domain protein [Phascolomyces articulosus]
MDRLGICNHNKYRRKNNEKKKDVDNINNKQDTEECCEHNNVDAASSCSSTSSSSDNPKCRRSGESYYSQLFGHINPSIGLLTSNNPPHGGRIVKLRTKVRQGKYFGRIVEAQTLNVKNNPHDPKMKKRRHYYEHVRMRPKELISRSFSAPNASLKQNDEHDENDDDVVDDNGEPGPGAIWAMKFSQDGRYMAAGGQRCVIRIWKTRECNYTTMSTTITRNSSEGEHRWSSFPNDASEENEEISRQSISIFEDEPIRTFCGHTADILDICWSKKHFLLSSSMDNCVMLWHISVQQCLCVFKHVDFVTSIAFHPFDDRLFLSGSADGKVRLWSVPGRAVLHWNHPPDNNILTAVNFTTDGKTVCAGSYDGQVFLFNTDDMKYISQFSVKKEGQKRGHKITGIQPLPGFPSDNDKILVTSNDSMVRLYDVRDQSINHKYKGAENESTQIKASFSDDGQLIVCGSDKGRIHIWSTNPHDMPYMNERNTRSETSLSQLITQFPEPLSTVHNNDSTISDINLTVLQNNNNRPRSNSRRSLSAWFHRNSHRGGHHYHRHVHSTNCYFYAHQGIVTCAIFAPTKTRQQLAATGEDIIYNHTHVPYIHYNVVKHGDDHIVIGGGENGNNIDSDDSSNDNTSDGKEEEGKDQELITNKSRQRQDNNNKNQQQQPIIKATSTIRTSSSMQSIQENDHQALKARLEYPYSEGQIIISADEHGCIKVWRIDSGVYESNIDRLSSNHTNSNQHSRKSSMSLSIMGGGGGKGESSSHHGSGPRSRLSFSSRFSNKK